MTTVDLYVDPVCPFAWVATQWMREVARQRDIDLSIQLMSLAVLNQDPEDPYEELRGSDSAWRPVRVGAALSAVRSQSAYEDFFLEFGHRFHVERVRGRDRVLREALEALDAVEFYGAADDHKWDEHVRRSHNAAVGPLGEGVGTPIIRVDGAVIFGPVLQAAPPVGRALKLFDAVTSLIEEPVFCELKRAVRGAPDPH